MPEPTEILPQNVALRRIDRAVHELRAGYTVLVTDGNKGAWLAQSAEGQAEGTSPATRLVITGIRAQRLGLATDAAHSQSMAYEAVAAQPQRLAHIIDPLQKGPVARDAAAPLQTTPANAAEQGALALVKLAALLPAVLVTPLAVAEPQIWAMERHILAVELADITAYKHTLTTTLTQVSAAHVPLKEAENARVLAFRPRYGSVEHLAICIGQPETAKAPLVRVHSSCITGDILGSLRCDCGEQLQEALARIAQEGDGVLLYLSQEGRGIGIVNKLRAYRLQDEGLDTVEANEEMGFAADERQFGLAARMLELLAIDTVRLLSNNPDKVAQLEAHGVTVAERISLALPSNPHNQKYLDTKEKRCGHVF